VLHGLRRAIDGICPTHTTIMHVVLAGAFAFEKILQLVDVSAVELFAIEADGNRIAYSSHNNL
jgi:hypothetical protein